MDSQRCMWNSSNNYDIELNTSNGNNSNRMELRTRGMFLDYRHNENYISDRTGWKIDQWPKGKSCVYFHRHMKYNDKTIEIKIDLFFYDDEGRRKTENSYSFDLFANLKHPHAESKEEAAQFKSSVEIQSQLLAKYSTYTIQEEWNISYAVQLCSEAFYLRVQ